MNKKIPLLGKESIAERMEQIRKDMDIPDDKEKKPAIIGKSMKLATSSDNIKTNPKVFVSGRLDRKKHAYTAKSLILLTQLDEEIKIYCRGGDLVILNYLILEGLKKVKESVSPINIDMEEIESSID